jgi:carbamoyl-phosphate synthase large subunit
VILNEEVIRIGITGTGSLVGQAIIKSIKVSEFADKAMLIGMDYFNHTVGSFWCDKNYLLPDLLIAEYEKQWEESVIGIIKENSIQILFIGVDFELIKFAHLKDRIENETNCVVIVSDKSVIQIADDKYQTYQFLKENKLFYPYTFDFETSILNKITYPCILKPRNGYRSRGVSIVNSDEELIAKASTIQLPIVQEYIGNDETEYTCGVVCLGQNIYSIILKRQLKDGNTYIAIYDSEFPAIINEYIHAIAKKLNIFGACNFQLRIDDAGIPKLFEINARHSGTTYIRTLFGFNEVELIINYVLGNEIKKVSLQEGKVVRYFDEMFIHKK